MRPGSHQLIRTFKASDLEDVEDVEDESELADQREQLRQAAIHTQRALPSMALIFSVIVLTSFVLIIDYIGHTSTPHVDFWAINEAEESFKCGISKFNPTKAQSNNGTYADDAKMWPWQVQLDVYYKGTFSKYCGGALLSREWILTAAHCVQQPMQDNTELLINVYVGVRSRYGASKDDTHFAQPPVSHHFTANWNPTVFYKNNIALIRLKEKLFLHSTVSPVCLPTQEYNETTHGLFCYLIGYGYQSVDPTQLHWLRYTSLKPKLQKECEASEFNDAKQLCTNYPKTQNTACQGNHGNPLLCHNRKTERWHLHGILLGPPVNWNNVRERCKTGDFNNTANCCQDAKVAGQESDLLIYTNVFKYRRWIEITVNRD